MARRVLVSWIGHQDLVAMARDAEGPIQIAVREATRFKSLEGTGTGPVKTAFETGEFDQVHLLSNYGAELNAAYRRWFGRGSTIHPVALSDPSDYGQIVPIVDAVMRELHQRHTGVEWAILLSPGTPAMSAIWVLLGKSRYPARFYQTFGGRMTEAVIPYELLDEYVPSVLRKPDEHLQRFAAEGGGGGGFDSIVGTSREIRIAKGLAARAAVRDVSVLLLGESGTGKEEFARAIHQSSRRRERPFIAVNCGAIPKELQEAALFGHVKGAFTGATADRPGAFAAADGGTLFLDEVGECPAALQVKLLRVLQPPPGVGPCHRSFEMVGGKPMSADVRVLAATNRDLPAAIRDGTFREDLYYRLNVIEIALPPLRTRRADIPLLAEHLLARVNDQFATHEPGYRHKVLSGGAKEFLVRCVWPGNVRQLQNALVRAAALADGDTLELGDLETAVGTVAARVADSTLEVPLGNGFSLETHVDEIRKHYLRRAMREAQGNKSQASRLLGIQHYQTLSNHLRRLGIDEADVEGGS